MRERGGTFRRYGALLALVAFAGAAGDASACSCAIGDPRRMLAEADGAFVGTLVERQTPGILRSTVDPVTLVFEVEEAVKGTLPSRIEVRTAASGASCGIEAAVGQRLGLFLERDGGAWRSSLCQQIAPDRLLAAAGPLPAPEGKGPLAVLVGGSFGEARVIALDGHGRTLGYGLGAGETLLLDACPGSRRALEVVRRGQGTALAVRDLRTLRVVSARPLKLREHLYPAGLDCRSRAGSDALLFATRESGPLGVVYRARGGRLSVLHRGAGVAAAFGPKTAYLTVGRKAERLLAVDLRTGEGRSLGRVPAQTAALALSPDGRRLAGVAYSPPVGRDAQPSRVVLVDLDRRPVRVLASRLRASNVSGRVFWLADERLVFLPGGGERDVVRVYDASLRERSRIEPWDGWRGCVRGNVVYDVGGPGAPRIVTAALPDGPLRRGSELPSPTVYTFAPVPGTVRVTAAAPAAGTRPGRIVPSPRSEAATPVWRSTLAAALVLAATVSLAVAVFRWRRRPRPAPYPSSPRGTA